MKIVSRKQGVFARSKMLESGISDEYLIYLSGVGEEEEGEEVFQDSIEKSGRWKAERLYNYRGPDITRKALM